MKYKPLNITLKESGILITIIDSVLDRENYGLDISKRLGRQVMRDMKSKIENLKYTKDDNR